MQIPLRQYWFLLAKYLRSQNRKVALLTVLIFSSIGIRLIDPQIIRYFIDTATSGGETGALTVAAIIFLVATVVRQAVAVGATYVGEDVGWASTNLLRRDLARHCLYLDIAFHNEHTPGEFIERIDGDVSTLANFFSQFTIQIVGNLILLMGVLILLFREDWRIGLAMGGFAGLMFVVLARVRHLAIPHWRSARQSSADFYGFLEERLVGTEDLRANGAKAYTMRRFYELARTFFRRELKAQAITMVSTSLSFILVTLGNATALLLSAYLFQAGDLTIGAVYLIFHYTNILTVPIQRISDQIEDLQKAGAGIARIQEFMALQPHVIDGPNRSDGGQRLPEGALTVAFQNVSFAYNGTEPVLKNLSFQLKPGTVLGLLGRTGSGKTTITRLITRLYDPREGHIQLGEVELRQARLADLRQRVGVVTQNVQLFQATVRDNLTLFEPHIPDEQILATLEELGLWSWFQSLPEGLDAQLEAGGSGLSTGEAQLLAFARVFLKKPGLIILDEASSRLDPATERHLEQAINKLLRGRTAIIIAHHLATLQRADEILILDGGRIVEYGPREQLAANSKAHFYRLLQTDLAEVLA